MHFDLPISFGRFYPRSPLKLGNSRVAAGMIRPDPSSGSQAIFVDRYWSALYTRRTRHPDWKCLI